MTLGYAQIGEAFSQAKASVTMNGGFVGGDGVGAQVRAWFLSHGIHLLWLTGVGALVLGAALVGRDLNSSASQLNLNYFGKSNCSVTQLLPQKVLMLSRQVDECEPLLVGAASYLPHVSVFVCVGIIVVGRCGLPVSKPMLTTPTVSALEAIIWYIAFKVCFQLRLVPLHRGAAAAARDECPRRRQGLTLVHFISAQPEPFWLLKPFKHPT